MKKLIALAIGLGAIAFLLAGCTTMRLAGATQEQIKAPIEKVAAAIKVAAPKAGLEAMSQEKDTPVEGEFKSSEAFVIYKKIDDNRTNIYVSIGGVPDRDREKLMVNEIKKELGIK
ncbi:MAG: DUF3568 family protein [Victivallales bacterium]